MAQAIRTSGRGMQTRSSKPLISDVKQLRKRRLPSRYAEDDVSPKVPEKFMRETKKGSNKDCSDMQSPLSKRFSCAKGIYPSPSKKEEFQTINKISVAMQCSDKDSIASCDSFDSGMGSRSDEDGVLLPTAQEKPPAKPITIEIMSPANKVVNVIEVFEKNDQEFVAYFRSSPNEDKTIESTNCTSCNLMKRSRMTRSISANVSEDSNDSAFHGFRPVPTCDTPVIKRSSPPLANQSLSSKPCKTKRPIRKNNINVKRSIPRPQASKRSCKLSNKKTSKKHSKSKSRHPVPCSPTKRALLRIQHHNRSPERPTECATPAVVAAHSCRTRSHAKSLLKDIAVPTFQQIHPPTNRQKPCSNNSPYTLTNATSSLGVDNIVKRHSRKSCSRKLKCTPDTTSSEGDNGTASDDQQTLSKSACRWRFCKAEVSPADLSEHIDRVHVAFQKRSSKMYKCFWEGCKVYGQVAKSIIWLEGHVKKHLGARPYHCIFPDCTSSFPSQELLQRHVDTHIDDVEPPKPVKKVEPSLNKKSDKKKIKRLRGTEKCIPKRTDFFTSSIVEAGRWEHKTLQENFLHLLSEDRASLKLQGQIVAMTTMGDTEMVQFHWFPEELRIVDSWHKRTDPVAVSRVREVKISELDHGVYINLLQSAKGHPAARAHNPSIVGRE